MDNNVLIRTENLKKLYPVRRGFLGRPKDYVRALDGVDIAIRQGETLGLVGESGCGKTTLGRCMIRLIEPSQGKVFFEDGNILELDRREMRNIRENMQIIFQDPYSSLNPRKTAGRIIEEPFIIHDMHSGSERQDRVKELMEIVGLLPEHVNRYPYQFSGGQRQRISLARGLALNPKLIIADEPVSALDVSIRAQIINLLINLQRRFNLTYLFISHDLSVVRHISDRVAVMYLGKVVELSDKTSLYRMPLHPYTEALISAAPVMNPEKRRKRIFLEGDVPSPINIPRGCRFHPRCPHQQDICRREEPEMREIEKGRFVTCHFPRQKGY